MAKRGPKRKPLDWNLLESLGGMQASCEYVSERMLIGNGIPKESIDRKHLDAMSKRIVRNLLERYGLNYVQYVQQKALEPRRIKLRDLQWKTAESGNATMQIWLGKQMLGQTDKIESTTDISVSPIQLIPAMTREQAEKLLEERCKLVPQKP